MPGSFDAKAQRREEMKMKGARPWQLEMALVDFRHAFWPWLVYAILFCFVREIQSRFNVAVCVLTFLVSAAAVVVQYFCADFAHGTIGALLTFPRDRFHIWITRFSFCAAALALPVFFAIGRELWRRAFGGAVLVEVMVMFMLLTWCILTMGVTLAFLFRRPLVVWTATFISPLLWIIICSMIIGALGLEQNSSFTDDFPFAPPLSTICFLIGGIISTTIAWRLWLRLEVRS